jgi:hypothetical protein
VREGPHVVEPGYVIGVGVGQQEEVEGAHSGAQALEAELGPGVHGDRRLAQLDEDRGAKALVARIGRGADPAAAAYDGDAEARARAEEGYAHELLGRIFLDGDAPLGRRFGCQHGRRFGRRHGRRLLA